MPQRRRGRKKERQIAYLYVKWNSLWTIWLPSFVTVAALVFDSCSKIPFLRLSLSQSWRLASQRIHGAEPRDILQLVLGQGKRLTCYGVALGSLGGVSASVLLASFLFNVRQTDALTYISVSGVLFGAAALACCFPARRAMRLAPMAALRHE